jgi:hypothetical protein
MSCERDIHVDLFDALPWLRRGVVLSSYCPYPFRRFVAYLRSRSCPGKCGAHEAKWPAVENRDMSTPISEIYRNVLVPEVRALGYEIERSIYETGITLTTGLPVPTGL